MSYPAQKLLPVDDLITQLLASTGHFSLESEASDLSSAQGRVLSKPIISTMNVPPFDNSAMDGYALAWHANLQGQTLCISDTTYAGQPSVEFVPESVVRILTGAPIPKGADTVVMQENVTHCTHLDVASIVINQQPTHGENIRRAGQDIAEGEQVLAAGTRLGAAEIGVLASLGIQSVAT